MSKALTKSQKAMDKFEKRGKKFLNSGWYDYVGFIYVPAYAQQIDEYLPCSMNADCRVDGQGLRVQAGGWRNFFNGTSWEKIDLQPVVVGDKIVVSKAPYTFEAPVMLDTGFIFRNDGLYDVKDDSYDRSSEYVKTKEIIVPYLS